MATTRVWIGTTAAHVGDFDYADNWNPSGSPADGDTLIMELSSQDVLSGFDQSTITPAALHVRQSYTGKINGYLTFLGLTALYVGEHFGSDSPAGSSRVLVNCGSGQATTIIVANSAASSADANLPPVRVVVANAAAVLHLRRGKVGLACETGQTATLSAIHQSWLTSQASDSNLIVGAGVTLTSLTKTGGVALARCALTTLTHAGGSLETAGLGAITTINANGGAMVLNSTGTIGTVNGNGAAVDLTKSTLARTITTYVLNGGSLAYDPAVVTITNKITASAAVKLSAAAA